MSLYIILYVLFIILLIVIGFQFILKNKFRAYGVYFVLSIFLFITWIIVYLLSFTTTYSEEVLLIFSRLMYSISIPAMYSMLCFLVIFPSKRNLNYKDLIIFFSFILLIFISLFTNLVINSLDFLTDLNIYKENFGELYLFYFFLYIIFSPIFLIFSYFKLKKMTYLNKLRLTYLLIGFLIFIFLETIFLALLPIFGIWILQKEQILFFLPFILAVFYVSHRYNFINIKFFISRLINFLLSASLSIILINIFRYYFLNYLDTRLVNFWEISSAFGFSDLFFGIILYIIFYKSFKKYFFGDNEYVNLVKNISKIKKKISFLSNFNDLNKFLSKEFAALINAKYVNIKLNNEKNNLNGLKEYFFKDKSYNLFINDTVFIEENKHKFDSDKILEEISDKSYLVFPLVNNIGEFLGVLEIGTKQFKDIYSSEEIDLFNYFIEFLILHLKHIEIYEEMQDININLDKKIDKKTIEYNNILNKQSDFISMISHEIKSPLGSCIFQVDSIIDDIKSGNLDKNYLLSELEILNTQLLSVGDLTKTMFSIKKFDLNKIELFRQKLDIHIFLSEKLNKYKKENEILDFIIDIDTEIDYIIYG